MVTRLKVDLEQKDYRALLELAGKDLRDPQNQIRFLIREAAQKHSVIMGESTRPAATAPSTNEKKIQ